MELSPARIWPARVTFSPVKWMVAEPELVMRLPLPAVAVRPFLKVMSDSLPLMPELLAPTAMMSPVVAVMLPPSRTTMSGFPLLPPTTAIALVPVEVIRAFFRRTSEPPESARRMA